VRSRVRQAFAGLLLMLLCQAATAMTTLGIITNGGSVSFDVDDDWVVGPTQTKTPMALMAFQLPNTADNGTPDSTNLIIVVYDEQSDAARAKYEQVPNQYGEKPTADAWNGWTMYRQEAKQGQTSYTILDAKRSDVGADVMVSVRLAWPHLSGNSPSYDQEMEQRFHAFLESVVGKKGPYVPKDGEVIRRPVQ
jgi:hypothetical protein